MADFLVSSMSFVSLSPANAVVKRVAAKTLTESAIFKLLDLSISCVCLLVVSLVDAVTSADELRANTLPIAKENNFKDHF